MCGKRWCHNNNNGYFQTPILSNAKRFTRSWRRWGGGEGVTKIITHVSLRLSIIIHQYIDVQSHLLHTHSLSLSPPHTHTHTHTILRANQADTSLSDSWRLKRGFKSRLEGVDSCISNVQWQWVPDRRTKVGEHDHLLPCFYWVESWGGGCQHWSKEIGKEYRCRKSER